MKGAFILSKGGDIIKIKYKNSLGGEISFTEEDSIIRLISLDGVSAAVSIAIAPYFEGDGGVIASMRSDSREIILETAFCGDYSECRNLLNSVFIPKIRGTLYYEDDFGSFKIDCIVKKACSKIAERTVTAEVALICPDPNWTAIKEQRITTLFSNGRWVFPFEIPMSGFVFAELENDRIAKVYNSGAAVSGGIFEIIARGNITNPKLQNINTYEWFELAVELAAEDRVILNTVKGQKSVKLIRQGKESDIINLMVWGSTFLQFERGLNEIVCDAKEGLSSLSLVIRFSDKFSGI